MTSATDAGPPGDSFSNLFLREVNALADRLGCKCSFDLLFLGFLRRVERFGYFTLGPISINVRVIESLVERTAVRGSTQDDLVPFSNLLMAEVRHSGRKRIDELHYLLAFMRCGEGLPARVFGELGVTPEEIERYLADTGGTTAPPLERLMRPEDVAAYLGVHAQTVRAWIRSGRLPARRVAGLRALRVRYSDVERLLQPLDEQE